MKKRILLSCIGVLCVGKAFSMKVDYNYDFCDGSEHHCGATIILQPNDIDTHPSKMQINYNKLGAAIIRGADRDKIRPIKIKGITNRNLDFTRALMNKAFEIVQQRQEVYVSLSFFNATGEENITLKNEWAPFQKQICDERASTLRYHENFEEDY